MARWNLKALVQPKKGGKAKTKPTSPGPVPASIVQPLLRDAHRRPTSENVLPHFTATASDHVANRTGDRFLAMRAKVGQVFTPSQPIGDRRLFAGRSDSLRTIIGSIENQKLHVVVYGERGIGKTSLLHMLAQAATEARYIVIYTSCGADSNFDDTFRASAESIPVLFHRGFTPTAEEAERGITLADLLPKGKLTPRQYADLCAKLTGTRVLIIIDEFDRCESSMFRRDVAELIKNLSDRLGRVQLVLAGVAADLTELVQHIPSIRRNIFALRVPKMTDAEVLQIIGHGEKEIGLVFEPAAREVVVAVARGSPYLANLLCHHASQAALANGRNAIQPADIAVAIELGEVEFQSRLSKGLQNQLRRLVEQGQGELLDLAARTSLSVDGPFGVRDLRTTNQIDAAKATRIIQCLTEQQIITSVEEDDHGQRYEFVEEGLPTYLWIAAAAQQFAANDAKAQAGRR